MRWWPAYSSNLAYCWSRNRRNSNVACLRLEARRFWLPASSFQLPNSEPKLLQLKPVVVAPANHPATVVVPVAQHHAPAGLAIMLPLVVKRPVGVADAQHPVEVLVDRGMLHLRHAAGAAHAAHAVRIHDGDAGGVIATVFQPLEALDQDRNHIAIRDRANEAAHAVLPSGDRSAILPERTGGPADATPGRTVGGQAGAGRRERQERRERRWRRWPALPPGPGGPAKGTEAPAACSGPVGARVRNAQGRSPVDRPPAQGRKHCGGAP